MEIEIKRQWNGKPAIGIYSRRSLSQGQNSPAQVVHIVLNIRLPGVQGYQVTLSYPAEGIKVGWNVDHLEIGKVCRCDGGSATDVVDRVRPVRCGAVPVV